MKPKSAGSEKGSNEFILVKCRGQKNGVDCTKWLRVPANKGNLEILWPSCGWSGRWHQSGTSKARLNWIPVLAVAILLCASLRFGREGVARAQLAGATSSVGSNQRASILTNRTLKLSPTKLAADAQLQWRLG